MPTAPVPLADLWPYLPAFRAIAEQGGVTAAAAQLHVVPSALSRALGVLEARLGAPLFTRTGGRLRLNARGAALLERLRQAMGSLERVLGPEGDEAPTGELRVSTLGLLTNDIVLPLLLDLAGRHPGLVPVMRNHRASEANQRLLVGELEAAFYYDALPTRGLHVEPLGTLTSSIYCGRRHPLFSGRVPSLRALLAYPFSVPSTGDRNTSMDGWPVALEPQRQVGFRIELLTTNVEVSLSGRYLTVLPDVAAAPHLARDHLRRFPFEVVPPVEVFGACRVEDAGSRLLRALFDGVRAKVAAARPTPPLAGGRARHRRS